MQWREIVRRRRMVRDFTDEPVDSGVLRQLLDDARRTPSAGFTQGLDWLVLNGPEQTEKFWDVTLPLSERPSFRWPGLLRAPVIVLPMADRSAWGFEPRGSHVVLPAFASKPHLFRVFSSGD